MNRTFVALLITVMKEKNLKAKDVTSYDVANWALEKKRIGDLISAIKAESTVSVPLKKKYCNKTSMEVLENVEFFGSMASFLLHKGQINEAEEVYRAILDKTPHDTAILNDYGMILLIAIDELYAQGKKINKERFDEAKKYIFESVKIDRCLNEDSILYPAFRNLSTLRHLEAAVQLQEGNFFAAFVLFWMSIEISIYVIWYQYLKKIYTNSKQKIDSLRNWSIEYVIEVLFLSRVNSVLLELKNDLDVLRGTRNSLLHGDISDPTEGEVKLCMEVSRKIAFVGEPPKTWEPMHYSATEGN